VKPFAAVATLALAGCAAPGLEPFRETLARQDSATAALGEWCAARPIADPPVIRAVPVIADEPVELPGLRTALGVGTAEPLGFRHVRLMCGDKVLSDARNWYVPARLTPEMNAALAATQTPFGKVAAPLGFTRQRIAEKRGTLPGCPAGTVLSHRAVLRLPDGRAIALVQECYTRANLAR
jgi:hypothetical protein